MGGTLRILLYTNLSPYDGNQVGGAETSLRLIGEKLAGRGHRVLFITKSKKSGILGFQLISMKGVRVLEFRKFHFKVLNRNFFKSIFKKIRNHTIRFILKSNKIDIVHTYYNPQICNYFLSLREHYEFKIVVRIAGLRPFHDIENNVNLKEIYRRIFWNVDTLNFISEGLKKEFLERTSLWGENYTHVPNFVGDIGLDIKSLPEKKWVHGEKNPIKLLMVGRFSNYQKRQDLLVDAFLSIKNPTSFILTFIGDGVTKESIKTKVKKAGMERSIIFHDFLNQDQVWNIMSESDLLCHACDHEGLSKSILEAMGIGLPVLASNVNPLNTYIIPGINGFLVDNTIADWSKAITTYARNKILLHRVSEESRNFIQMNYAAETNAKMYEEKFLNLLDRAV